jgi:anti-sigma factor RsiW
MVKFRCQWVHDRLPLLVGDELCGLDRRRVERHLIGCPQCRQHQAALGQTLEALRTVAATSPVLPDAPSLWPALARQIRESRRPVPTPAFAFPFQLPFASALAWPRANPWPALGLGLGLLAAIGASFEVRQKLAAAQPHSNSSASGHSTPAEPIHAPRPRLAVVPEVSRPDQADPQQSAPAPDKVTESSPASPLRDYDLDHLRPPSPDMRDARDTRDSKFTY